jgi:hypothetical protein
MLLKNKLKNEFGLTAQPKALGGVAVRDVAFGTDHSLFLLRPTPPSLFLPHPPPPLTVAADGQVLASGSGRHVTSPKMLFLTPPFR